MEAFVNDPRKHSPWQIAAYVVLALVGVIATAVVRPLWLVYLAVIVLACLFSRPRND
jgi:hypothetical protein